MGGKEGLKSEECQLASSIKILKKPSEENLKINLAPIANQLRKPIKILYNLLQKLKKQIYLFKAYLCLEKYSSFHIKKYFERHKILQH